MVVVLARTQNSLGSQTQLRLDEGLLGFDTQYQQRVVQAIDTLADVGPGLGRPLVDTIH